MGGLEFFGDAAGQQIQVNVDDPLSGDGQRLPHAA